MNLNQVTIVSTNVLKTLQFYQQLGLVKIVDSLPRYVRLECPNGQSTLSIQHADAVQPSEAITLYFEVTDVSKTVALLSEKGINPIEAPEAKRWLWVEALYHDPNGHAVIIYHAGVHRKNPPWRV